MSDYSLTEKGKDAITKIIKRSPQYKELIKEFLDSFDRMLDKSLYDGRGIQDGHHLYHIKYPSERIIKIEREKWEKRSDDE